MAVSTVVGTAKKLCNLGFLSLEINFRGNLLDSKCDGDYSIICSFTKKACKFAIKRDSNFFS